MTTPPPEDAGREESGQVQDEGATEVAGPRSGLRNPEAAARGLGAATLGLEAIVLLLAIQPIRIMGGELRGWGIGVVIGLAVMCAVIAGSMRRRWAWHAGTVIQGLLLVSGVLHWSLAALGLIFGAAWGYATHVRRTLLADPVSGPPSTG